MDLIESNTDTSITPDKSSSMSKRSANRAVIMGGFLFLIILVAGIFMQGKKQESNEPIVTEKPGPITIVSQEGVSFLLWQKMPGYASPNSKYITRIFSGRKFVFTAP